MRKILLFLLVIISVALGWSWSQGSEFPIGSEPKEVLFKFGLVADSENENDLLAKALSQLKNEGIEFVIGLGDWSSVGTIEELTATKNVFDESGLTYYVTAGDHDLWDSRNRGLGATTNFRQIFGDSTRYLDIQKIAFVILDNSDIYTGIKDAEISNIKYQISNSTGRLTFVFAHKTPFHPQSAHIMGEDNEEVKKQASELLDLIEKNNVDGFFSGDLHFFAQFNSPNNSVKITTIGAVNSSRNFQGPRFAIGTVYDDYSWEVEDVEIR